MLNQVRSHLVDKPKGDRRETDIKVANIKHLGSQCIAVIRYHAAWAVTYAEVPDAWRRLAFGTQSGLFVIS